MSKKTSWSNFAKFLVGAGFLTSMFFAVNTHGAWTKVKLLINEGDVPFVEYEEIDENAIKIVSNKTCIAPKDYDAKAEAKFLACANGKMAGSILGLRIADTEAGIRLMQRMLDSLGRTKVYVKSVENKSEFDLWAIPAGLSVERKYPKAETVAIKCLQDKNGGNTLNVPVGVLISERGQFFDTAPRSQLNKIQELRTKNKVEGKVITDLLEAGKAIGPIQATLTGLAIKNVQEELAKVAIPVTKEEISKFYPEFANRPEAIMGVYAKLILDGSGNRIIPKWTTGGVTSLAVSAAGITPPLYKGTVNADGAIYDFPDMVVPYVHAIEQAFSAISQHEKRLLDLKRNYENSLKRLQTALNALKAKDYNCA